MKQFDWPFSNNIVLGGVNTYLNEGEREREGARERELGTKLIDTFQKSKKYVT